MNGQSRHRLTAEKVGLTQTLLARADEVIE